jgi:hypothetical protein
VLETYRNNKKTCYGTNKLNLFSVPKSVVRMTVETIKNHED